jgi:hypothetical protein
MIDGISRPAKIESKPDLLLVYNRCATFIRAGLHAEALGGHHAPMLECRA